MNLRDETLSALSASGKQPMDVRFVSDSIASCSWESFAVTAEQVNYDDGFGGNEIPLSLVVVGDDWWLERGEYDGSEWWEFKRLPPAPPLGSVVVFDDSYGKNPTKTAERR